MRINWNFCCCFLELLQSRRRIGVAIGEEVLDLSVAAPVFFTGPVLSVHQEVSSSSSSSHTPNSVCMLGGL